MTEYQLSNDELELLSGLEESESKEPKKKTKTKKTETKDAARKAEDLDQSTASFYLLKELCAKAMESVRSCYGDKALHFEICSPCGLPYVDGSGSENFVGMEEVILKAIVPTRHRGGILFVFEQTEPRPDVAVWFENLQTIFGQRGAMLKSFCENPAIELTKNQQAILSEASAVDRAQAYKENDSYGTW